MHISHGKLQKVQRQWKLGSLVREIVEDEGVIGQSGGLPSALEAAGTGLTALGAGAAALPPLACLSSSAIWLRPSASRGAASGAHSLCRGAAQLQVVSDLVGARWRAASGSASSGASSGARVRARATPQLQQ